MHGLWFMMKVWREKETEKNRFECAENVADDKIELWNRNSCKISYSSPNLHIRFKRKTCKRLKRDWETLRDMAL